MQPDDFDRDFANTPSGHIIIGQSQCSTYSELEGYTDWVGTIDFHSNLNGWKFITSTFIVDLGGIFDYYTVDLHMRMKKKLRKEIHVGARAYWYRQFHREYYWRALAQWLQRELELPGEIAVMISEFA
jgi:hypothetical protein